MLLRQQTVESAKKYQERERELTEREDMETLNSEVSALDLSPPKNGTPARQSPLALSSPDPSPIPISGMKTPGSEQDFGGKKTYNLIDKQNPLTKDSLISDSSRRKSVAKDALANPGLTGSAGQRTWWAEQRSFLMDDLYSGGGLGGKSGKKGTPTPTRNSIAQDSGSTARQLASTLDAEADDDAQLRSRGKGKDENVEWMETVGDSRIKAPGSKSKKSSKGYP